MNPWVESLIIILSEAYAGPADPRGTWFVDNAPDVGILGVIKNLSAKQASTSVDGSGGPGTSIASHVEHLRWSLANANGAMRGAEYNSNWSESWAMRQVDDAEWANLQKSLRSEFEAMVEGLRQNADRADQLQGDMLTGLMALLPHAAYHLGMIRQMVERIAV